ncbi:MAG: MarR family transcriptional regulator [Candidatus Korobacteraceae bacterium]|jgi:predicted transcriptional regulator
MFDSWTFQRPRNGHAAKLFPIAVHQNSRSLAELAQQTGRKKPNLSRTLKTMEQYGLVKVSRHNRRLVPKVDYSRVAVVMELSA